MKFIKLSLVLWLSIYLLACTDSTSSLATARTLDVAVKSQWQNVIARQQSEQQSASVTETGIKIVGARGEHVIRGQFETLAMVNDQDRSWYFSIEDERKLIVANQQGILSEQTLPAPAEGLCADMQQGQGDLVVLMENGQGLQFHLQVSDEQTLRLQRLRTLSLPPLSEFCVMDITHDRILVSEEGVGVWALPLDLEKEMQRTLVDTVAQGHLQHTATAMAILKDRLWVVDEQGLNQYQILSDRFDFEKRFAFSNAYEADQLLVSHSNDKLEFSLLDDNEKQWLEFSLTAPTFSRQTLNAMVKVKAMVETEPVPLQGDVADDPAIWVHPTDGARSLVLGTNKKAGLHIYNLQGNEIQRFENGRLNNVDVIQGFTFQGQAMDIAAASHRDHSSIALFSMDPETGRAQLQNELSTGLSDVYGFCMGRDPEGQPLALINAKNGRYEVYAIKDTPQGWLGELVRQFKLPSQPEGCVYDRQQHIIFMGEEDKGIWTLDYIDPSAKPQLVVEVNGDWLVDDVEGLDIYYGDEESVLVVSSQGNDSYVLLKAQAPYEFMHRFKIGLNLDAGIDGASETDGLAVTSANLGSGFEQGMLVVQDGRNFLPKDLQNFKYVSWQDIVKSMVKP